MTLGGLRSGEPADRDAPSLELPAGACDCHMHIIDRRFRFAEGALRFQGDATVADYRAVQERTGLSRAVVVQPSHYGTDNTCLLSALDELGKDARGVAVVGPSVSDSELKELHERGVRGIRCRMTDRPALDWNDIPLLANKIEKLGWHLQLQMDGRELAGRRSFLEDLPCDVVVEHTGKFFGPVELDHPGCRALLQLLDTGRVWVKLSGLYNTSKVGPPSYEDLKPLTLLLLKHAQQRMVWASDWPFVLTEGCSRPDVHDLLRVMLDWVPEEDLRRKLLSRNPEALYGFPAGG